MGRALLIAFAALVLLGNVPVSAENDRNNEPTCRELGTVDPRCF